MAISVCVSAQETEKPESLLEVNFISAANSPAYVSATTKFKAGRKFTFARQIPVNFYLDSLNNPIGSAVSDSKGRAVAYLPASLKSQWDLSNTHKLIAVSKSTASFEAVTTELEVTKARLLLDSVDGQPRTVRVRVMEASGNDWIASKDVEVKIMIRRMGGDLPIGEEENYSTDSLGEAFVEFKRENIPGDEKGRLIFIAKIDQNDRFGTVTSERVLPWGTVAKHNESFFESRTLYATGDRAPIWLLFFAGSIIAIVWGSIIYLLYLLIKMKRVHKWKASDTGSPK